MFLYGTRLLIIGVGVCALAGTVLSVWDPAQREQIEVKAAVAEAAAPSLKQSIGEAITPASVVTAASVMLKSEITPLKTAIQAIASRDAELNPGVFVMDLDNNSYADINGTTSFAAASTIKLPILIAFFQDVDAGKIRLDETLTLKAEQIATGSGDLQYQPVGSQYSALQTATLMMTISDNTATNMIIDRLGGVAAVNQRLKSWGLTATDLKNRLPDLEGTNLTSPRELVMLMARVDQGEMVSLRSRDRILDIMQQTETAPLLKSGLGEGTTMGHKTGNLGGLIADVGWVDLLNGKRYLIAVMVKRPFNDPRAADLITEISQTTYEVLSRSSASPTAAPDTPLDELPGTSADATANRRINRRQQP